MVSSFLENLKEDNRLEIYRRLDDSTLGSLTRTGK